MLNLAQSFMSTFISVIFSFLNLIKGPVALVFGVILVVFMLASPAEAAMIQCNASHCDMLVSPVQSLWDSLSSTRKASLLMFIFAALATVVLVWHDKKEQSVN